MWSIRHRNLLKKYIVHLINCKSSIFLDGARRHSDIKFTDVEWSELQEILAEILTEIATVIEAEAEGVIEDESA